MTSQLCPQCGGRKVIAVGVHETPCDECGGTGTIGTPKKKKGDDGPEKSDS